ncbi:hypothetical protein JCGZ_04937 [Jatropha curcas]|uniref:Aminotransferase-like plant mobile domain-containing protein n=1 Tax=Jatropha curcas TaxID=180498 RepID=A0A067KXV0_JATCU|nr:hypothetical protein JCGZ_04937 [Jatropha curcas]
MAHLPEIPASAYTPKMDILGVLPDIPVFEGERVPVSRNALTLGTRPLQLLSLLGSDFPIRHDTDVMRGFQSEVNLGKARAGGFSTDASAFWNLLDPPIRSRVVAAGFGDYAAGLCRTQPRFPPTMRYALMELWNDYTHSFIFGFGEMTLTPADFTTITGLGFNGKAVPLDSRYTAKRYVSYKVVYKFWAERIRTRLAAWRELPVDARPAAPAYTREERDQAARSFIFYIISSQLLCTSQNKGDPAVLACLRDLSLISTYDWASLALAHLYQGLDVWIRGRGESNWQFLRPLEHMSIGSIPMVRRVILLLRLGGSLDTWRITIILIRVTRIRTTGGDILTIGPWLMVLEIRIATAQRRVPIAPPRHMCILEGMTPEDKLLEYDGFPADDYLIPGDYASYLTTRLQARLQEVREYSQDRRRHRTPAFYRAQAEADVPAGSTDVVLGDVPFPLGMEVALDPTLRLGLAIAIPADLRQALPQLQLDPEHATHVPAQRYQELYQRFCVARTYIASLYPKLHERELEIDRMWRHQSYQVATVSRLQMEVDRLRTRLEVEGIPLDFSEEDDDDDDGSSSDDAPLPPPSSVRHAFRHAAMSSVTRLFFHRTARDATVLGGIWTKTDWRLHWGSNPESLADESWELEFPDEHLLCVEIGAWKLYFDGSANRNGAGAGIVIEAPNGDVTPLLGPPVNPNKPSRDATTWLTE